ncbi:hypothetical protein GGI09_002084 [Coemansia sp. S100]|nr:hypothetical protein GGI09_002084 [Coemansia sp. S100]
MSATIHIADGAAVELDEPQSKKYDSLPLPSTTGTASSKSISSGLKLFQILHYLNPLFYARLVQAYIQTVLRSYSTADGNARITDGQSLPKDVEIARGTTVDNCFTTVSPEFEYSCRLAMDGAYQNSTSAVHMSAPLSDVSLHLPKVERTGDTNASISEEQEGLNGGQVTETTASMGASATPPDEATGPVSTQPTEQDEKTTDAIEGKRTRKAKRGKGKGKAKP